MARQVLNVSQARAALPGLIRSVSAGGGSVAIGARGAAQVVLVAADEYAALLHPAAAPRRSVFEAIRVEVVGRAADVEADLQELRAQWKMGRSQDSPAAEAPARRPRIRR